jgi:C1A family cysteine protease
MSTTKVALVLGLTALSILGAMQYYKSNETPMFRVTSHSVSPAGIEDLELRLSLFKEWMQKYNRRYGVEEVTTRFALWNKAYDYVQDHNSKGLSWTAGTNQFADLSDEEFNALHLGFDFDSNRAQENVQVLDESDVPNDIDWREKGAVTKIDDQGNCGSCYTFSSAAALEGLYFIKKGTLVKLSKQQLLDCTSSYGNQGCNGGLMDNCFKYTQSKGIEKDTDYLYKGKVGTCAYNATKAVYKNTGFADVTKNNYKQLQAALTKQPVSVAVQADQNAFKSYTSGILSANCGTSLDHAILAVGYASNYWIVKNSWGTSWGEQGYIRIASGTQNNGAGVCGINAQASYPTGA